MLRRIVIQTVVWFALQAVLLLGVAGDWTWPQGWTYLGEVLALWTATTIGLMRDDPQLLEARLSSPLKRNQRPVDRAIMMVFFAAYVGWFVLIGLDHRFMWSGASLLVQILGAALIGAPLARPLRRPASRQRLRRRSRGSKKLATQFSTRSAGTRPRTVVQEDTHD